MPCVISPLDLAVMELNREVRRYRAKHTASRMVVLPAPVGPVMTKIPVSVSEGWVRSMLNLPAKEFRFSKLTVSIFMFYGGCKVADFFKHLD